MSSIQTLDQGNLFHELGLSSSSQNNYRQNSYEQDYMQERSVSAQDASRSYKQDNNIFKKQNNKSYIEDINDSHEQDVHEQQHIFNQQSKNPENVDQFLYQKEQERIQNKYQKSQNQYSMRNQETNEEYQDSYKNQVQKKFMENKIVEEDDQEHEEDDNENEQAYQRYRQYSNENENIQDNQKEIDDKQEDHENEQVQYYQDKQYYQNEQQDEEENNLQQQNSNIILQMYISIPGLSEEAVLELSKGDKIEMVAKRFAKQNNLDRNAEEQIIQALYAAVDEKYNQQRDQEQIKQIQLHYIEQIKMSMIMMETCIITN